jgi:putative RecB family exonuclease
MPRTGYNVAVAARKKTPAPPKPRLPRFSPTRLSLYLFCPRAYALQYDQGLRWGFTSPAASFGGSLHRALQAFHAEGGAASLSPEQLKEKLAETWSAAGYASEEQAAEYLGAAEQVLEQHHAASLEPGRETLATEITVQRRYDDVVLFGKLDRLDRRPDGALEVIDYKSSRRIATEEDVRASLAMTLYQVLVWREHEGVPVHTTILNLRTGDRASVLRGPEELAGEEQRILGLARTILADAEKLTAPGAQCRGCPYPRVCPEGRGWLKANGAA